MGIKSWAIAGGALAVVLGAGALGYHHVHAATATSTQLKQQLQSTGMQNAKLAPKVPNVVPQPLPKPSTPPDPQAEPITPQMPLVKSDPAGATSLWFIGYVPEGPLWNSLYVVAWAPSSGHNASLVASVINASDAKYQFSSESPRPIGALIITGITGVNGVISFNGSSGVTGHFNMGSRTWSFN